MSAADHKRQLEEAARRLDEISELLGNEATEDSQSVELAREAAQIAADVGAVAAEAAQAASQSDSG